MGPSWPDDDALRFIRRFPDKCCVEVSRKGESQPCDKPAVAVASGVDEWEDQDCWWPVCAHHSRGRRMVSLPDLIKAVSND
jgi:hypothetical protein